MTTTGIEDFPQRVRLPDPAWNPTTASPARGSRPSVSLTGRVSSNTTHGSIHFSPRSPSHARGRPDQGPDRAKRPINHSCRTPLFSPKAAPDLRSTNGEKARPRSERRLVTRTHGTRPAKTCCHPTNSPTRCCANPICPRPCAPRPRAAARFKRAPWPFGLRSCLPCISALFIRMPLVRQRRRPRGVGWG